jgi:multiple sugar transport system permease protein
MMNDNIKKKMCLNKILHNDNTVGYVFAAPFIIGFLGFTIIPILVSLYYSFTNYNLTTSETWIGLQNYARLFQDARFLKSVRVTLIYVLTSVPLKLIFALFIAYLLTKKSRGVTFYRSLYYVPSLIGGSIAVALVWKELFSTRGLINSLFISAGLEKVSWFGDQKMAMIPLVLMSVWQFGSSMIIFAAGLKEISPTYYEAAKIDGANKRQIFSHITLPCLSPIILYNLVMQTISAFMSFTQAFVITRGGPNDATNFYALYVYNQAFKYYDMGYASAMSWVMLIIMSLITFLIFKSSKRWVFSEAGE